VNLVKLQKLTTLCIFQHKAKIGNLGKPQLRGPIFSSRAVIRDPLFENHPSCWKRDWKLEYLYPFIADIRDYLTQLEPSSLKDKWHDLLLPYERIAAAWDDYCTHHFIYDDFRHYMDINEVEWR